jgi:hypothetical protein
MFNFLFLLIIGFFIWNLTKKNLNEYLFEVIEILIRDYDLHPLRSNSLKRVIRQTFWLVKKVPNSHEYMELNYKLVQKVFIEVAGNNEARKFATKYYYTLMKMLNMWVDPGGDSQFSIPDTDYNIYIPKEDKHNNKHYKMYHENDDNQKWKHVTEFTIGDRVYPSELFTDIQLKDSSFTAMFNDKCNIIRYNDNKEKSIKELGKLCLENDIRMPKDITSIINDYV